MFYLVSLSTWYSHSLYIRYFLNHLQRVYGVQMELSNVLSTKGFQKPISTITPEGDTFAKIVLARPWKSDFPFTNFSLNILIRQYTIFDSQTPDFAQIGFFLPQFLQNIGLPNLYSLDSFISYKNPRIVYQVLRNRTPKGRQ